VVQWAPLVVEPEPDLTQSHWSTRHLRWETYVRCCSYHHYIDLYCVVAADLVMSGTNLHWLGTSECQSSGLETLKQSGSDAWDRDVAVDVADSMSFGEPCTLDPQVAAETQEARSRADGGQANIEAYLHRMGHVRHNFRDQIRTSKEVPQIDHSPFGHYHVHYFGILLVLLKP